MAHADLYLGKEVHKHLVARGVETPMVKTTDSLAQDYFRMEQIRDHFKEIFKILRSKNDGNRA